MNLLLDTHIVIWSLSDPARIPQKLRGMIESPENQVWVSSISLWEIVIKTQLGKLTAPGNLVEAVQAQEMQWLSFAAEHAAAVAELPNHHRDPFDRALIAQSIVENLKLVTADTGLQSYKTNAELIFTN